MLSKTMLVAALAITVVLVAQSKRPASTSYTAALIRPDGNEIRFEFILVNNGKVPVIDVLNGKEKLRVNDVVFTNDSVFIIMPLFESAIKASVAEGVWKGLWSKETSKGMQVMPFTAQKATPRFALVKGAAKYNISGRWEAQFASDSSKNINAVGEFAQQGNKLTGTFLTTTGDYRYLQGVVTGNQLKLSTFDGGHAFLFTADITSNTTITNGKFYSGAEFTDEWLAVKNSKASIPPNASAMYLQRGESRLNFTFPDLDSNLVSINDERFKNKVVIVQILGSWCPNCMDETAFLSDYYKANRQRGIEVIGLAYEYSTNFKRSVASVQKFTNRFKVDYPMLITGVTVTDTLRTQKTLPEVTPIKVFPSTIIIDKKGVVRRLDNGFYGPGTGSHYEDFKKQFYATVDGLLRE